MTWPAERPITYACPTCNLDTLDAWRPEHIDCDWRDDAEREAGYRALATVAHDYEHHRVDVKIGDIVRYWAPWRGRIFGSDPLRVDSVRAHDHHEYARSMGHDLEPLMGLSYRLVSPHRPRDESSWYFPFVGDPARPIVFEVLDEAPPVELDLMDLLDWTAS